MGIAVVADGTAEINALRLDQTSVIGKLLTDQLPAPHRVDHTDSGRMLAVRMEALDRINPAVVTATTLHVIVIIAIELRQNVIGRESHARNTKRGIRLTVGKLGQAEGEIAGRARAVTHHVGPIQSPFAINGKIAVWSDKPLNDEKSKDKNADYVIWEGKDGFEWECPISVKHPYCRGTWQRYDIGLDNINIDALVAEQSKNAKKWNNAVKAAKEEYKEKSPFELSGGQKRRVALAGIMAMEPEVLILDEPAAGMNPNETQELMDVITFIREKFNMTILLIEHDMRLVGGICEKLTVLNFGTELAKGATAEVLNNPEVIKAYLGGGRKE